MPRNGTGTYVLPVGNPVSDGAIITATWGNTTLADIATALTNSLSADGQTSVTANIPLNNFRLTGLGAGVVSADAAQLGQVQTGVVRVCSTVAGTGAAYTATLPLSTVAFVAGQEIIFTPHVVNTGGTATLALNGGTAYSILCADGTAITAGDLPEAIPVVLRWSGAAWWLASSPFIAMPRAGGVFSGNIGVTKTSGSVSFILNSAGNVLVLEKEGDGDFVITNDGGKTLRMNLAGEFLVATASSLSALHKLQVGGSTYAYCSTAGMPQNTAADCTDDPAVVSRLRNGAAGSWFLDIGAANGPSWLQVRQKTLSTSYTTLMLNPNGGTVSVGGVTALANAATSGFFAVPTMAGTPSGVPSMDAGSATKALVYDTTANKLWLYNGAWRSVTFA